MAILEVTEKAVDRPAALEPYKRSYTRLFEVKFDAVADDQPYQIFESADIPNIYEPLSFDTTCHCLSVIPRPLSDTRLIWHVACKYETRKGFTGGGGTTDQAACYTTFSTNRYEVVAEKAFQAGDDFSDDGEGNRSYPEPSQDILNSAGEQFTDLPTRARYLLVVHIEKDVEENEIEIDQIVHFKDSLNDAEVTIAGINMAQYTGRMIEFLPKPSYRADGSEYYRVRYSIEYDPETHLKKLLNKGWYYNTSGEPTSPELREITDNDGKPKKTESLLDANGGIDGAKPSYETYRFNRAMPWDELDLPADLFDQGN